MTLTGALLQLYVSRAALTNMDYRQVSNIRRTKSQHNEDVAGAALTGDASTTSKVHLISEILQ